MGQCKILFMHSPIISSVTLVKSNAKVLSTGKPIKNATCKQVLRPAGGKMSEGRLFCTDRSRNLFILRTADLFTQPCYRHASNQGGKITLSLEKVILLSSLVTKSSTIDFLLSHYQYSSPFWRSKAFSFGCPYLLQLP